MPTPRGISVHLAAPDPGSGCCVQYPLDLSETAARTMADIAGRMGFSVREPLIGDQVTSDVVKGILCGAACELMEGDVLLLTYAGHGCREVVSAGGGQIARLSENWCLADRPVFDTELYAMWPAFKRGVRIILLSDSCHSGTIGGDELLLRADAWENWRALRAELQRQTAREWEIADEHSRWIVPILGAPAGITASILVLGASQQDQPAQDGLFTAMVKAVLDSGGADDYYQLREKVKTEIDKVREDQTPCISVLGQPFPKFLRQKPFTIPPPV